MNIKKLGRGWSAGIEDKTSNAGNSYEAGNLCQSVKNKEGGFEKKFLNFFPNELPELIMVLTATYNDYLTAKTDSILGKSEPKQDNNDDLNDEVPF